MADILATQPDFISVMLSPPGNPDTLMDVTGSGLLFDPF